MQYGRTRVHPLNTYPDWRMSGRARACARSLPRSWLKTGLRIAETFESFELIQPLGSESQTHSLDSPRDAIERARAVIEYKPRSPPFLSPLPCARRRDDCIIKKYIASHRASNLNRR